MQFERNRMYRVRAVADALDVSVATIYRAVETGALQALKLGTSSGTVRVPGSAVLDYLESCASTGDRASTTVDGSAETAKDGGDAV